MYHLGLMFRLSVIIVYSDPGTKNSGVFYFVKGKLKLTNNIDYSKLNDRIVKQAYTASGIKPADLGKIYEAKVARAQAMIEARAMAAKTIYHQIED